MLSVLIPVYNFDVRNFISQIHEQAIREKIKFEIILADDASDHKFKKLNSELENLPGVKYIQFNENIGRSKIRNFLADKARYEYLMFIDCDMSAGNNKFLHNYINSAEIETVICGGITYQADKPKSREQFLRWYYGIKREKKSEIIRNQTPYASFMSSNFLIPKKIFKKIQFDERISNYGHEDTLFGIELKRERIKIKHIDNPLLHIGLEPSQTFLLKTEKSVKNLIFISENYIYPELYEEIKLLKTTRKIRSVKFLILIFFNIFRKQIFKNLNGEKPKLFLFDLYKSAIFFKNNN